MRSGAHKRVPPVGKDHGGGRAGGEVSVQISLAVVELDVEVAERTGVAGQHRRVLELVERDQRHVVLVLGGRAMIVGIARGSLMFRLAAAMKA